MEAPALREAAQSLCFRRDRCQFQLPSVFLLGNGFRPLIGDTFFVRVAATESYHIPNMICDKFVGISFSSRKGTTILDQIGKSRPTMGWQRSNSLKKLPIGPR